MNGFASSSGAVVLVVFAAINHEHLPHRPSPCSRRMAGQSANLSTRLGNVPRGAKTWNRSPGGSIFKGSEVWFESLVGEPDVHAGIDERTGFRRVQAANDGQITIGLPRPQQLTFVEAKEVLVGEL